MHSAKQAVGVQVVIVCLAACGLLTPPAGAQAPAAVPVFKITPGESAIQFAVKASVAIEGTFDQWEAAKAAISGTPSEVRSLLWMP